MLTLKKLKEDLLSLGIKKKDILHMHSSMTALGPVEKGFDGVTQVFQDLVSDEGLFSVPTHSWDIVTKDQPVYHRLYTPSNLGAYSNYMLGREDFKRSLHPTHSVSAWGAATESFLKGDYSTPCPENGSYGKLLDWKGKIILLGVNCRRNTFFHLLEEKAGLGDIWSLWEKPVPFHIFDESDQRISVNYRGHRDCRSEYFYRIENDLISEGIMTQGFAGPAPIKIVDAVEAADWLLPRLKKEPKFFW